MLLFKIVSRYPSIVHKSPNISGLTTLSSLHFSSSPSCFQYKSSISLDKLYPDSQVDAQPSPEEVVKNASDSSHFSGYIPMNKLKISYMRSSGPGGQHVNTTNSKVELRFHLDSSDWIADGIRKNMKLKYRNWMSKDGYFIVESDKTRSQHMNVADALVSLRDVIHSCVEKEVVVSEDTLGKLRRQQEKANRERLRLKRERSIVKESRGAV